MITLLNYYNDIVYNFRFKNLEMTKVNLDRIVFLSFLHQFLVHFSYGFLDNIKKQQIFYRKNEVTSTIYMHRLDQVFRSKSSTENNIYIYH